MMIPLQTLLDDHQCYEVIRQLRWPDGVRCPHCGAVALTKQGRDTTQPARRNYRCQGCERYFDDLMGSGWRVTTPSRNCSVIRCTSSGFNPNSLAIWAL